MKWIGCGWHTNWRLLDLEEKMKWIQDENEEMEEIGEQWDRLDPYTESDCKMVQIAIWRKGKRKTYLQPSTPVRGREKKEVRRRTNIVQEEKSESRECSRTRAARKVCSAFGCKNISNYRNIFVVGLFENVTK